MSIRRRGLLGLIAAAPVAAPAMAQEAMKMGAVPANHGLVGGMLQSGAFATSIAMRMMEPDEAIRKAFKIGIVSRETVEALLRESGLGEVGNPTLCNLDPDLQAAKSFSMATRIRMQRDRYRLRNVDRFLAPPKTMWEFGRDLIAKGLVSEETP